MMDYALLMVAVGMSLVGGGALWLLSQPEPVRVRVEDRRRQRRR